MIRPFLKWAGGKRQLLPKLRLYYPDTFDRYVEPFVGSGAVFFDLYGTDRLRGRPVVLADCNPDLIGCYQALRDRTEAVIAVLDDLDADHRARGSACYYDVRDNRFNPQRQWAVGGRQSAVKPGTRDLLPSAHRPPPTTYTPELAAMFIYLNRTGFNGLFRLNRRGAFNVPAGRYSNPRICDAAHLRAAAAALRMPGLTLTLSSFDDTLGQAGAGDFVYCDPPYAPLSRTSLFAHYTASGFTMLDHRRLHTAVVEAVQRGATVVLSNSSAPEIVSLYANRDARHARLRVERVQARRAINSRATHRGPVEELIITNVKLRMAKSEPRRKLQAAIR